MVGVIFADQVVNVKVQPAQIKAGESGTIIAEITIPKGEHAGKQEDYLYVDVDPVKGIQFSSTEYPDGKMNPEGTAIYYYDKVVLKKKFTVANDCDIKDIPITVKVGYQFCLDTGMCHSPEEVPVTKTISVLEGQKEIDSSFVGLEDTTTVDTVVSGVQTDSTGTENSTNTSAGNMLKYLFMAFIGGIILNIMPCVLPVLSIKALSIVSQSNEEHSAILKNSLAYTAGIFTSFIILSAAVIIIKISGEMVGWGFQFQNPTYVLILVTIIYVFALSLFDVFLFQAPGMQLAAQASSKHGLSGSFFSGVFAVLLATPCTAPFLGTALGFAFSQTPTFIFMIFMAIALGLSLPFLLLGFFPKVIKAFPKPGAWMNTFKEIMGFILMATAVWLLDVLRAQIGGENLIRVLVFLVITSVACWMYGRFVSPRYSRVRQWITALIVLALFVTGASMTLRFKENTDKAMVQNSKEDVWQKFDEKAIQDAIASKKAVFIDFTADWCMTCKTNEKVVLNTTEVLGMFKEKNVMLFQGDFTKNDKTISKWIKSYKKAGVPVYVLYNPNNPTPTVFPELITKPMILDALKQLP